MVKIYEVSGKRLIKNIWSEKWKKGKKRVIKKKKWEVKKHEMSGKRVWLV